MSETTEPGRTRTALALLLLIAAFASGLVLAWLRPAAALPTATPTVAPAALQPAAAAPATAPRSPREPAEEETLTLAGRLARVEQAVVALTARLVAPVPAPETAALQERIARLESALTHLQPAAGVSAGADAPVGEPATD